MNARAASALLLALALGCAAAPAAGPEAGLAAVDPDAPIVRPLAQPGWVEVVAQVVASDDEAPSEARARAMARARQAAVEHVAGVRVQSGLLSFEQVRDADASSLVQTLLATRADALVLEERLITSQRVQVSGGYRLRVVLRAHVLDRRGATDPGFRTEIALGRNRFLEGEEVTLALRASRDARLYVLAITEDGAALLLPNGHLDDTRVPAGEWLHFPDEALHERGVRLIARLPEGRSEAREALVVVALRGDRTLGGMLPASGAAFRSVEASGAGQLLADLLSPLLDLPADEWTFDQVVYEVLER